VKLVCKSTKYNLTKGKEYTVVKKNTQWSKVYKDEIVYVVNDKKETKGYLRDSFYTLEELRDYKLNKLFNTELD